MENRKTGCIAALFIAGMLQVGITIAETYSGVGTDVDASTGQAGTTSGITGSDMNVADETTGEGQAHADQIHRAGQAEPATPVSAADQPEEEAPPSATGSEEASEDKQGTPQASSSNSSEEESQQSGGQQ